MLGGNWSLKRDMTTEKFPAVRNEAKIFDIHLKVVPFMLCFLLPPNVLYACIVNYGLVLLELCGIGKEYETILGLEVTNNKVEEAEKVSTIIHALYLFEVEIYHAWAA